jgi:hypothetical protein
MPGVEDDGVVVVHPVDAPPEVDAVVRVAVPGVDVRTVGAGDLGKALVIRLRRVLAAGTARLARAGDEVDEELPVPKGSPAEACLLPEGKLRPLDRLRLTRHQERIVDPHHDQVVDVERPLQSEVVAPDPVRPVEQVALQRLHEVVLEEQQLGGGEMLVHLREPLALDVPRASLPA